MTDGHHPHGPATEGSHTNNSPPGDHADMDTACSAVFDSVEDGFPNGDLLRPLGHKHVLVYQDKDGGRPCDHSQWVDVAAGSHFCGITTSEDDDMALWLGLMQGAILNNHKVCGLATLASLALDLPRPLANLVDVHYGTSNSVLKGALL